MRILQKQLNAENWIFRTPDKNKKALPNWQRFTISYLQLL
jgi:hypothetical protein